MLIAQEDMAGCGVACVAALLGMTYKQALALFDEPERAALVGFYCRDIVAALRRAGQTAELKYVKPQMLPRIDTSGTIVFTPRRARYPLGHYYLRTPEGWMNPWANFPKLEHAVAAIEPELPAPPNYAIFADGAHG